MKSSCFSKNLLLASPYGLLWATTDYFELHMTMAEELLSGGQKWTFSQNLMTFINIVIIIIVVF